MAAYCQSGIEVLQCRETDESEQPRDGRDSTRTPLLVSNERDKRGWRGRLNMNFKAKCHRRCCLRSKAALLMLIWNLIIVASLSTFFDPSFYIYSINNVPRLEGIRSQSFIFMPILYGGSAFLLLFYPLAGCMAETRWGRYKTILTSVYVIFGSLILMVFWGGIVAGYLLAIKYPLAKIVQIVLSLGIPFFLGIVVIIGGFVAFSANVIQFGLDQLHDASTDDSVLYIHWYVWTSYLGLSLIKICTSFLYAKGSYDNSLYIIVISMLGIIAIATCFLGVTICIYKYKGGQWFIIDSGSKNPYKLVYRVLKFAKDHTNPIRRSAFTYCEDELPSRLDLGKEKYGGPFTTEQVEDVKAFLGILCILLSLGPILTVDISVSGIVTKFSDHIYNSYDSLLIKSGGLILLLIAILIPMYLSLLRPFLLNCIPGILKRIGLGMIFIFLSALCTLALDTYGHTKISNLIPCFASYIPNDVQNITESDTFSAAISSHILIIQNCLNAIGYLLLYIAIYEFICAQSPHGMKGLLIGTFFAVKGVFQLIGIVIVYLPFTQWKLKWQLKFPSCGFVYYLINVIIALIGIVAYTCIARKYQYRVRDEPDNIYRYAEEYYANTRDEPNDDYDDYDNLDVHTINS